MAQAAGGKDNDIPEDLARVNLSRKKLRKIRLQSSRIKLPPPKLDQCGLGFEPYKDAPEFQRYRAKRKQQARDRASYNATKRDNVYRISDVALDSNSNNNNNAGTRLSSIHPNDNSNGGEYLTYETAEDFVGKRSAAGFALRDDEDDAYDDDLAYNDRPILQGDKDSNNDGSQQPSDRSGRLKIGDEYNTEVYEHESSDDDVHGATAKNSWGVPLSNTSGEKHGKSSKNTNEAVDIGNMFAAWAGTDQQSSLDKKSSSAATSSAAAVAPTTSDGRPPLPGFVLGDYTSKNKQRYPGPEIPRDYAIRRHEFGENENPYVFEAISNAVRLEQREERWSQLQKQREKEYQNQQQQRRRIHNNNNSNNESSSANRPLSKNFSSLGEAMKRRFTSSTEDSSSLPSNKGESETSKRLPAGLHMPMPVERKTDECSSSRDARGPKPGTDLQGIKITRTVESFFPNPLVCKRFRVPPMPTNARKNSAGFVAANETRNNESAYFEREILSKAKEQQKKGNQNEKHRSKNADRTTESENPADTDDKPTGIARPSIAKLRSIFEASSDESSLSSFSENDDKSDGDKDDTAQQDAKDSSIRGSSVPSREDNTSSTNLPPGDTGKQRSDDEGCREIVEYKPCSLQKTDDGNHSSRNTDIGSDEESSSSSRAAEKSSRIRKKDKSRRRHHRHHRKRHKRKRSHHDYDSDRSSLDERDRRKEKRRKEHKKKKKKNSSSPSSSRHRSRKREKSKER